MSELNASIRNIPMPPRMSRRPISRKGFPVPYFVTVKDENGDYDFRAIESGPIVNCIKRNLCWLCGDTLGQFRCFVIGPMCAFNRISAEPPSHRECAEYAVKACPFLSKPNARRNEAGLVEKYGAEVTESFVGGHGLKHNPGVTLLWITKHYKLVADGNGGILWELGDPIELYFIKEGRKATRAEIDASISIGLPKVRATAESEGPEAVIEFEKSVKRGLSLLPAE